MIKVFHEAPKSIFKEVQELTDGDYFLANVLENDPEYLALAKEAVASGRTVILDNGVFETGVAQAMERFVYWINEIKPTYYIVPDVLEDKDATLSNMAEWIKSFKGIVDPSCKMMGVVQGKTWGEIVECYTELVKVVDKIAIPFDLTYYQWIYPHPNKLVSWCYGRVMLLSKMVREGIIDENIPVHLLGCSLIQEFGMYDSENFGWIESLDTSNPVAFGLERRIYNIWGTGSKPVTKMYTQMNEEITEEQWRCIATNIKFFKTFSRGNLFSLE